MPERPLFTRGHEPDLLGIDPKRAALSAQMNRLILAGAHRGEASTGGIARLTGVSRTAWWSNRPDERVAGLRRPGLRGSLPLPG
jgi:hypothetical protein